MLAEILNAVALVLALIALVISVYNWRTADRAARNDILADVRDWGNDVIDALSEAHGLCALNPKLPEGELFLRRSHLMCKVSALLDRGRLFFPNTYHGGQASSKRRAYGGKRPPILGLLALAHELIRSIDSGTSAANERRGSAFVDIRREFVSVIQDATTFAAPTTAKKYEIYLTNIFVEPLPNEIRVLADVLHRGFGLTFKDDPIGGGQTVEDTRELSAPSRT